MSLSIGPSIRASGLLVLLGLSGCGLFLDDDVANVGVKTRSAVVHATPPEVCAHGTFGGFPYEISADGSSVVFPFPASPTSLSLPDLRILVAQPSYRGTPLVEYLLVGAIDAQSRFTLFRYRDLDGDGAPDPSTQTFLLTTSPSPAFVTDIAEGIGGTLMLLDRRCQDVLLATDADGDGWADTLRSTPFAEAATFPSLLTAAYLETGVHEGLRWVGARTAPFRAGAGILGSIPAHTYTDVDGDGDADVHEDDGAAMGAAALRGFRFAEYVPYAGGTQVRAEGFGQPPGSMIELWRVDSAGADLELLGQASLVEGTITVPLASPLVVGHRVALGRSGAPERHAVLTVVEALPQLSSVAPTVVRVGMPAVLTLRGASLSPTMIVEQRIGLGAFTAIPFSLVTSDAVTVEVMAHAEPTVLRFRARSTTQDPAVAYTPEVEVPVRR